MSNSLITPFTFNLVGGGILALLALWLCNVHGLSRGKVGVIAMGTLIVTIASALMLPNSFLPLVYGATFGILSICWARKRFDSHGYGMLVLLAGGLVMLEYWDGFSAAALLLRTVGSLLIALGFLMAALLPLGRKT